MANYHEPPTDYAEYVLVETDKKDPVVVITASHGREMIRPGIGARMPLRQALDIIERADEGAQLRIAGVVSQLEPDKGVIKRYIKGNDLAHDPVRMRDSVGFPLVEQEI